MHPESHPLESSFEPAAERPQGTAGAPPDPVVADFNAFFEKLSALDDLQWSAEPTAAPAKPAARPAAAPHRRAPPAPPPRMTVVKSEAIADVEPVPVPAPDPADGRVTVHDVARFLKTTLVGLVLFALGLGAGWAALSLPGHFHQHMPSFAQLVERARSIPLPRFGAGTPGHAGVSAAQAGDVAGATAASAKAADAKDAANGPATATAPTAQAKTPAPDARDPDAGLELPQLGETITVAPGHAHGPAAKATHTARTARAVRAAKAAAPASQPAAVAQAPAHPAQPAGPQYTLQVGACTSYACVQAYQRLLQPKVDPHTIKVVTQTRAGAPNLQRVRIQPLGRAQAERLKSELAAIDPRFKGAYLIALH